MPPLRKRRTDIPLLVDHFLKNAQKEGMESDGISKEALALMIDYSWPGNVRELQSAIRFALVKSHGNCIHADHLPKELQIPDKPVLSHGSSRKLDKEMVRNALEKSGGNKAKAARMLGVGRATLYRFLSDCPNVS
jgi:DNA-binding NtrC family response regulator